MFFLKILSKFFTHIVYLFNYCYQLIYVYFFKFSVDVYGSFSILEAELCCIQWVEEERLVKLRQRRRQLYLLIRFSIVRFAITKNRVK